MTHPPIITLASYDPDPTCPSFGAGKDTAADYLVEKYGYVRVAFGDFVRDEVSDILTGNASIPDDVPDYLRVILKAYMGRSECLYIRPYDFDIRVLLQGWGTEYRRKMHGLGYWVNAYHNTFGRTALRRGIKMVISDRRFPNEGDYSVDHKGENWNILRPSSDRQMFLYDTPSVARHESETALEGCSFHVTLYNGGTLQEFHHKIDEVMTGQIYLPFRSIDDGVPDLGYVSKDKITSLPAIDSRAVLDLRGKSGNIVAGLVGVRIPCQFQ